MRIGFDAKRAFFNRSGLGNYSRNTIIQLVDAFPDNSYHLYTPSKENIISFIDDKSITVSTPESFIGQKLKSAWRSLWLGRQLKNDKVELFHGLSNELPKDICKSGVKSVVTIHDLIFMRHPEWYKPADRKIYKAKFSFSAKAADKVIAISEQTKSDLVEFLNIDENKIEIVYQGCHPIYRQKVVNALNKVVIKKYNLPENYILYVGTIEERKNALNIVKAIHEGNIETPLVIIGKPTPYTERIHQYILENDLSDRVKLFHNVPLEDLPSLYQMANLFVYPSTFEGFGIPILEALYSGIPVITSKGGCFKEAGGKYSKYVDPKDIDELANAIKEVLGDKQLQVKMITKGLVHAQKFNNNDIANNIMSVYKKALNT
jgi:glycosyltransferase involved in cell wall biosynthesis